MPPAGGAPASKVSRETGFGASGKRRAAGAMESPEERTVAGRNANLPWVEKYRPQTLNDLISHQDILSTRTGKTSTILACAKQLYKDKEFNSMVLELNASDDRGIDIVRGPILNFASTRTIFKKGFKLVILDEADAMTQEAQNALRRGVPLLFLCQSTNMAFGKVTEETVYTCTGQPLRSDIANILNWMLNQDFTTAYHNIMELKTLKGLALHDILTEIHLFVHRVDFPSSVRIQLLIKMANIE
ncbi:hypothetical protein JD844_014937 [Phrynosoma platyrhinos]|uniref:Replication factor C C-terminal domain-containing protein n=1 Tax=Phrynosoma platyrhinos TaxID=52577 RepID=A0ABQ7T7I9_PHRPL|nr:hypothetical protein JD844_014937 [Phrynosoma platyrhinos]